jgi:hypothetical protein
MKTTSNTFEIIDSEDIAQKLQKTNLAIKYLDFLSSKINSPLTTLTLNEQIKLIKSTQSLNALNYCLYYLKKENYELLTDISKASIVKILVSLLKAINSNNQKSVKTSAEDEWDILNRIVESFSMQSVQSNKFCIELCECVDFNVVLFQIIENFELGDNEPLLVNLIKILLSLSKFHKRYPTIWTKNSIEIISQIKIKLEKLNEKTFDLDEWYIFLIFENLNKDCDPDAIPCQYFDTKIFFEENAKDENDLKLKKRDLCVKYLKYVCEPSRIINSEQCMNIIFYLTYFSESIEFRTFEHSLQVYFTMFTVEIIKCLHEEINKFLLNPEKKKKVKSDMILVDKLTCIILNCSSETLEFCSKFHKVNDSIKTLLEFINNEVIQQYLIESTGKNSGIILNILKDVIENILCSLHNLSRVSYKYKSKWDEVGAVNSLSRFLEKVGHLEENFRVFTYFIMSNIASDKEIETLKEIKTAIKFITEIIIMCSESIENKTVKRNKVNKTFILLLDFKNLAHL